ncbi:MAG: VOC family protein [Acidobacteriota bacterium]
MNFQSLTPMLRTTDLKGTIEFYTRNLGFTVQGFSDKPGWASLKRDSVSIMLAAPNQHELFDAPAFTGSLYLACDDVDAVWEMVREKAKVCYPIENFEYGMREFAVYDNNGYLLQFGQEIKPAEVTGTEGVGAKLRATVAKALPLLSALSDALAGASIEEKWSAKQVIGHLIDSACNNHRRFVLAQGRGDLLFEGYEQEHWVRVQRYGVESWHRLLALWSSYNQHLAWVIDGIAPDELAKPRAVHSLDQIAWKIQLKEEAVTLSFLTEDYVDHLENHLRQILPDFE